MRVVEADNQVTVSFWLEMVIAFDRMSIPIIKCETKMQYWADPALSWNPSDYDGIEVLRIPATDVWKPDLLVYNTYVNWTACAEISFLSIYSVIIPLFPFQRQDERGRK